MNHNATITGTCTDHNGKLGVRSDNLRCDYKTLS